MTNPDPNGDAAEGKRPVDMRETYRKQLRQGIGGWSGMAITAIPTVVFVLVNVLTALRPAIYAAVGSAVLLAGYRLIRRQPVQQALSGLFGVAIAALIAARTGQARGYFLFGILTSFAYAVPFVISLLVRRPIIGLLWEFLDPTPGGDGVPWHRRRALLRAYELATAAGAVVFLARGSVQLLLYRHHYTLWLGIAKIAMGYPLFLVAAAFAFWVIRRARKKEASAAPAPDQHGGESAEDVAPDRGLGFR